ncbi:MAG: hypothetical protein ABS45_05280 [Comamonas sp. SCN 65-56]|nr:MAG: hypothetical protein ABS45_05280 [Comamonas sp. SCN 65-56]
MQPAFELQHDLIAQGTARHPLHTAKPAVGLRRIRRLRLRQHAYRRGFAQHLHLHAGDEAEQLRALSRDARQGGQRTLVARRQRHLHQRAIAAQTGHHAGPLVAHAGAYCQLCGSRMRRATARHIRGHLRSHAHQRISRLQQFASRIGQPRTAATHATDGAPHQRHAGKVGQGIQRLPGRLVAHADAARRLRDRAALVDLAQDGDASVGLVLPQGIHHGKSFLAHDRHHAALDGRPMVHPGILSPYSFSE